MKKETVNKSRQFNPEQLDRNMYIVAFAVFLIALKYIVSASMTIAGPELNKTLDVIELVLALSGAAAILFVLGWKFRQLDASQRKKYFNTESYVVNIFNVATMKAFGVLFLILALGEPFIKKYGQALPTQFYINMILAIMLVSLSTVFFYKLKNEAVGE